MTIVAILVALAVLYWLGSLAYAYFANSTERSRLNESWRCPSLSLLLRCRLWSG